ncbi:TPA: helix-turn-helix transcriptional regulator [Bacillus pseudomycoides]|nr:helix-turn-helix transcriptional regulator [Bacillus pseudomycoides]
MYGHTMKQIRKMKGFTQKEVYTGIVSKTFYSDFEAGKYSVSIKKFEGLLQSLNVSFDEFMYFYNQNDLSDSRKLDKKIDELYKKGKFDELFAIYERHFSNQVKEIRYLAAKAYLLVLITHTNFYKLSRDPFIEILADLENAKMWTLNEIKLAKLVLLSIPEKELDRSNKLFARIKKELTKYKIFDKKVYFEELADLFFNRIQSLLILNDIKSSKEVLNEYSLTIQSSDNMNLCIQLQFISILVGLYYDYPTYETKVKKFFTQMNKIPVSECHFYRVIFDVHNEKAKNYFLRYFK